jgi:hypothetical protein
MTPDDFMQRYKNLMVLVDPPDADDTPFWYIQTRITRYVIYSDTTEQSTGQWQQAVHDSVWQHNQKVRAKRPNKVIDLKQFCFTRVRYGKATPDDMEHVLFCAVASGKLPPDPDKVQQAASTYLGVDCSGFVSAYFHTEGKLGDVAGWWDYGPRRYYDLAKGKNQVLWDFNDIATGDVLIWAKVANDGTWEETRPPPVKGHISLVHLKGGDGHLFCRESNGATGEDPRSTDRIVANIVRDRKTDGKAWNYWELEGGDKVLVIRPY